MAESIKVLLDTLCEDPGNCRERLLNAAGLLFAARGLEGVSTRELTRAADANLSAIAYYFGGKDNLYKEAVEDAIARAQEVVGGTLENLIIDTERAGNDPRLLARAAIRFVRDYAHAILSVDPANWRRQLLMREMDSPGEAFDHLYKAVFQPHWTAFAGLVGKALCRPPDDARVMILASALFGQCLTFNRNRWVILRNLDWEEYAPDQIDLIVETILPGILGALGLPQDELGAAA